MLIPSAFDPAQAPNSEQEQEQALAWPELRAALGEAWAYPLCGRWGFLPWGRVLGIRALSLALAFTMHSPLPELSHFLSSPRGPWGSAFT